MGLYFRWREVNSTLPRYRAPRPNYNFLELFHFSQHKLSDREKLDYLVSQNTGEEDPFLVVELEQLPACLGRLVVTFIGKGQLRVREGEG